MWHKVLGFENYQVNECGVVRNSLTANVLKQRLNKDGYPVVHLNRKKQRFVHRLMADAFLIKAEGKTQVNHKNGIKNDNDLKNLEWVTASENQIHSRKVLKNRCAIGELSGSVKLTESQVRQIRFRLSGGKRGIMTELSKEFGVTIGNIAAIKTYKSWNHI